MTATGNGPGRLFGTDGVRGRANREVTPDLAFGLARAAGEGSDGPVVIGMDTRRSGPMLVSALHAGFNSVGVDTIDLGIVPVGAVSLLTRATGSRMGVMVSASHNPAEDNGIKFFGMDGRKLADSREDRIQARLTQGAPWKAPDGAAIGMQMPMPDVLDRYVTSLAAEATYTLRGMEFTLDCANGAAFRAAPMLFERLKASVDVLNADPDGTNINDGCGATHPEFLAAHSAGRVGFAFDGDADRLIAVDEDARVVNGDVLMAIFARHLKEQGKLRNGVVVATVMSNLGFRKAMEGLDIKVIETKVGDRYVLEAMHEHRAVLGGEQSGHLVLEDRTTGDGLRSALRVAEVMAATGSPLTELRTVMTEYPQVLHNVRVANRSGIEDAAGLWAAVSEAERSLHGEGRVLVRASGTEPLVRVMVEATDTATAERIAAGLAGVVTEYLGRPA